MEQNKTGKYFKYAIGEIVLVVIGILIALSINNWNEGKKGSIKEQKLFTNLNIDFNSRLLELEELLDAKRQTIEVIKELNLLINTKEILNNEERINQLIAKTLNGFIFNEQFKMLDVIFNTGLINDIESETLKRKLIDWPQEVEEMLEEQRTLNGEIIQDYRRLYSKYISSRKINEEFKFRNYELPKGQPITLKPDYEGLFNNVEFENLLAEMEALITVMAIDNEVLIKSAKEITKLLEN